MTKNQKRLLIGGSALLLLAVAAVWYLASGSSRVARVRQLRDQLFSEKAKDMTPEQRKEGFGEFRKEMDKLTPKERDEVFADRRKKMADKFDKFFKLTPEQQAEQLDKDIDDFMEKGKRWMERAAKGGFGPGAGGQGGGGPGAGGPGGAGLGAAGGQAGARGGQAGGPAGQAAGPGGGGQGGGWFGGRGLSQEQRDQFRKNRLDASSPEFRAQTSEYFRQFRSRMQERGISFGGFGRPR